MFDHREPGTSEQTWTEAAPWQDAAAMPFVVDRLLVIAAHPDDETLAASGLIAAAHSAGVATSVLILTDGQSASGGEARSLAVQRRIESIEALAELTDGAPVQFAGLVDGTLRENRSLVRRAITDALSEVDATDIVIVAPWWGDGHRDHRIAGEVAREFVGPGVRVFGYPLWLWHWGDPRAIDTEGWHMLPLDERARDAKRRAIDRHRSQITGDKPIIHSRMRAHFERPFEIFIAAEPGADPDEPPGPDWFTDFYARHDDPWGFETRWYEHRKRDVLLATLPDRRYRRALELGCATGLTTARLAARCDEVAAVDVVEDALKRARAHVAEHAPESDVEFLRLQTPAQWPDGEYDLIVLSELAYYWTRDELAAAPRKMDAALSEDGVVVACHWRHPIRGCAMTGDDVHRALARHPGWVRRIRHIEDDFVLDVFRKRSDGIET
ncbi:PIG-L family deacetylase [Microbacterium koreense]|uniref:PIG-L family deacetylase n=1 Tax=Microbacterium koreense TaxID=323761 RepID=A0ABW2ZP77_9MICO